MKRLKTAFSLRGAWLNCPLPLALEAYWNCEADCLHCPARHLNRTWGNEQRVIDPEDVRSQLERCLVRFNQPSKSPISQALRLKKALFIGRKTDPYQPVEMKLGVVRRLIQILLDLRWPAVICTRYLGNAVRDTDLFLQGREHLTLLAEITVGGESDWELLERSRTTPIHRRLRILRRWKKLGIKVGVRGEPFIPGYHTPRQFRDMLQRLKSFGLNSYNTYNLHMNDFNLRRLHEAGLDIERIWTHNQDRLWRPLQRELCAIAEEEGVRLGCPDFVNVPKDWKSRTNTCCGVDVEGAFTFNTHFWRSLVQIGKTPDEVWKKTWEGIGTEEDQSQARIILTGSSREVYTMKDAGL